MYSRWAKVPAAGQWRRPASFNNDFPKDIALGRDLDVKLQTREEDVYCLYMRFFVQRQQAQQDCTNGADDDAGFDGSGALLLLILFADEETLWLSLRFLLRPSSPRRGR